MPPAELHKSGDFLYLGDLLCEASASVTCLRLIAKAVIACAKIVIVPHHRPLLCA